MKKCMFLIITFIACIFVNQHSSAADNSFEKHECPHCGFHLYTPIKITSKFGAERWSDYYRINYPHHQIVKCLSCKRLFWIDEAKNVSADNDNNTETKKLPTKDPHRYRGKYYPSGGHEYLPRYSVKHRPEYLIPSSEEYSDFLINTKPTGDKERYARLNYWWSENNFWRYDSSAESRFSSGQKINMKILLQLLDENDETQRIIKAEISRELGDFNSCLILLRHKFESKWPSRAAALIKDYAEKGDCRVREIPNPDINDVYITLERFGAYKNYLVVIHGNGIVEYNGTKNVAVSGQKTSNITQQQIYDIVQAFHDIEYFEFKDHYYENMVPGFREAIEPKLRATSTKISSIRIADKFKMVENYYGGPEELDQLENLIDHEVNIQQWIGNPTHVIY